MVPRAGVEPARDCSHRILSPGCLPVPPPRQVKKCSHFLSSCKAALAYCQGVARIRTGDQAFAEPCLSHLATTPEMRI